MNALASYARVERYNALLRTLGHTRYEVGYVYHDVAFGQSNANLRLRLDSETIDLISLTGRREDLTQLVTKAAEHGFEVFSPGLGRVIKPDDSASDCPNPS